MEARIGRCIERKEVGDYMEVTIEPFYYSDGYIIIRDDYMEGFLTNDLVVGTILLDNEMYIQILENNQNENDSYYTFSIALNKTIEFPENYCLFGDEDTELALLINFIQLNKLFLTPRDIEQQLNRVKRLHPSMP